MTVPVVDGIRASLGGIALAEEELQWLASALTVRHPSVLRWRRGAAPAEFHSPLQPVPWYELASRPADSQLRPSRSLPFAAADFYLQDAGSLLALAACDADRSIPWWYPADRSPLVCDLCAAPGGKASALAEMLGDDGFLLANEPIRSRVPALAHNLARTGSDRYAITTLDPRRLAEQLPEVFDMVLVDAPCSGQALLSRGRQTAAALSQRQIDHSAARQRRILGSAIRLLRPGGMMVYSTCTFAEAENETQVRWLASAHGMQPVSVSRLSPYASPAAEGCYRLWPHRHATAGSFAATLLRGDADPSQGDTAASPDDRGGRRSKHRDQAEPTAGRTRGRATKEMTIDQGQLQAWFRGLERVSIGSREATVIGWPDDVPEWVDRLAASGPELAYRTGRTWKPAHAAAVRRIPRAVSARVTEVDEATARQFLSGEPLRSTDRGWFVVSWRGRPLGWAKGDGSVAKNHLPTPFRMECTSVA